MNDKHYIPSQTENTSNEENLFNIIKLSDKVNRRNLKPKNENGDFKNNTASLGFLKYLTKNI